MPSRSTSPQARSSLLRALLRPCLLFALLGSATGAFAVPTNTHPLLYSTIDSPTELSIENLRVVSEILQGDGRTQITFAADLLNHDSGSFQSGRIQLGALPPEWSIEVTTDRMLFGEIAPAPSAAVLPTQNIVCLAPAASLTALRTAILAGQYLTDHADEWMIFTGVPALMNDLQPHWKSRVANLDGSVTLSFASAAAAILGPLGAGDVLTINPRKPLYYRTRDISGALVTGRSALEDESPFEITSIATVGADVLVTGRRRDLDEVLESATLVADQRSIYSNVDFYDPTLENTYTLAEEADNRLDATVIAEADPDDPRVAQLMGFRAKPIPFSVEFLNHRVKLAGELHLRALSTSFEVKIRNFVLRRLAFRVSNHADVTMAITAAARSDNTSAALIDKEKIFDPVALPAVPINLGGVPLKVQPWLTFKIGAELNVPQRLTIPLMASYSCGLYMGWDSSRPAGDEYFFEPFQEVTPLQLTDPTLFNNLAATASAYAEAGIKVIVSEGSPPLPGLNDSSFISAGPSFSARLTGTFTLAPLGNPWWTLEGDMRFFAGFNWSILGYDIIDRTAPVFSPVPLFSYDAGGPLLGPRGTAPDALAAKGGAAEPVASRLTPTAGTQARWGRAFQLPSWPGGPGLNSFGEATVVPVTGGGDDLFFMGNNSSGVGAVLRVNGQGDRVWTKQFPSASGTVPTTLAPTPDGGFILVGGRYNGRFIAKYDAAATRQWSTSFSGQIGGTLNFLTLEHIAVREPTPGTFEYYLAGHHLTTGHVASSDPLVMKFDHNGAIVWMKSFGSAGDDEVYEILSTSDGNLVLCGTTDADVAPPAGTPGSEVTLVNATDNGLLMKITPDGALVWATAYASRHPLSLRSVAEAPDGSLFASGTAFLTVVTEYPAMFVGHFNASDGSILQHVTIGTDPDSEDPLPPSDNTSLPGVYKNKAYDIASQIRWTAGGLTFAGTTRLGDARSMWAGGLTSELGLRWFTVFDGRRSDELYSLCATDQGLALAGSSNSFLPFGTGNTWASTLLKLPWEGVLEFHEATRAHTAYIKPRIYQSSGTKDFQVTASSGGFTTANAQSPVAFVLTDLVPVPDAVIPDLVASATASWVPLERRDPAQIQNYTEWVEFFQIPAATSGPTQNHDPDARTNGQEYFFGGSPFLTDPEPPLLTIDELGPDFLFTVPRSTYASNVNPVLETSTDLIAWTVVPPPTYSSVSIDAFSDLLSFTVTPTPEPRRFWRVSSPVLP